MPIVEEVCQIDKEVLFTLGVFFGDFFFGVFFDEVEVFAFLVGRVLIKFGAIAEKSQNFEETLVIDGAGSVFGDFVKDVFYQFFGDLMVDGVGREVGAFQKLVNGLFVDVADFIQYKLSDVLDGLEVPWAQVDRVHVADIDQNGQHIFELHQFQLGSDAGHEVAEYSAFDWVEVPFFFQTMDQQTYLRRGEEVLICIVLIYFSHQPLGYHLDRLLLPQVDHFEKPENQG